MKIYAVWAAPLAMAGVACLAASPLFARADDRRTRSTDSQRLANIDGLRGYLALSVVLHHGVIFHQYLTSGVWKSPTSGFYTQLGQASVGLFFIITGFLFWAKILRSGGVLDYPQLLVGRAFRIGPVYLALIIPLMMLAIISQDFSITLPPSVLVGQFLQNLALGILPVSSFNGVDLRHQAAGVTWTLVYEWEFYLLLPAVAFLAWRADATLPAIGVLLATTFFIAAITGSTAFIIMILFLMGMLCATLAHRKLTLKMPNWPSSAIVVAALAIAFGYFPNTLQTPWATAFLGLAFYFLVCGADLFGFLHLRASQRLGAMSYDLYLCHGAVLSAAFAIPALRETALSSPRIYWLILASIVIVALLVAMLLHIWIERPGMELGRRTVAWLRTPHIRTGDVARQSDQLQSNPVAVK